MLKVYFLEVKNDVCDIFLDAGDSVKLVFHSVNADRRNGETFEGGEKDATQGVANGYTISRFQWLKLKFTEMIIGFQHEDFVGFLEC